MGVYVRVQVPERPKVVVTDACKSLPVGAGNRTWGLLTSEPSLLPPLILCFTKLCVGVSKMTQQLNECAAFPDQCPVAQNPLKLRLQKS